MLKKDWEKLYFITQDEAEFVSWDIKPASNIGEVDKHKTRHRQTVH